jgi:hypothetical protein
MGGSMARGNRHNNWWSSLSLGLSSRHTRKTKAPASRLGQAGRASADLSQIRHSRGQSVEALLERRFVAIRGAMRGPGCKRVSASASGQENCMPHADDFPSPVLQSVELGLEYSRQSCESWWREEIGTVSQEEELRELIDRHHLRS